MTGWERRRAALVASLVCGGVVVLAWAATSGPVAVMSPSGRTRSLAPAPTTASVSEPTMGGTSPQELARGRPPVHDLSWLGDLIAWALVLGVVALAAWGLRYAVLHRWRRPPPPITADAEPLPEVRAATALVEDAGQRMAALAEGDPRNGIVRCWMRLEESVADAGLPRKPHETSAEFTVRVLHVLDLDPHAIGDLAGLYREARFSEHPLTEDARTAARDALTRLQDDLAMARSGR
jgi:hypothetical protein